MWIFSKFYSLNYLRGGLRIRFYGIMIIMVSIRLGLAIVWRFSCEILCASTGGLVYNWKAVWGMEVLAQVWIFL